MNLRMCTTVLTPGLLLMALAPGLSADSFRCKGRIVRTGDSPATLLERCGKPLHRDRGMEEISVEGSRSRQKVERWYYQPGKGRLGRIVLIHAGRIVAIETGSR